MGQPDMSQMQARIAAARKSAKMSLQEVADSSGFTKSHVWELENGRSSNPTVRAVWSLAEALGVTPAWLLGLDDQENRIDPLAKQIALMIHREVKSRISMGAA